MAREYGNLWRYRNEGVEAFNKIVSLRYNKFNKRGGYKKTRAGDLKRKCNEFWSLGQWLGRWSLWHLGYADAMHNDGDDIADWEDHLSEDIESDETYRREDDSDSDSCGSDINVEDVKSDALTLRLTSSCVNDCESVSDDDDDDEIHFNGVWYITSHDYDSDCLDIIAPPPLV